MEVSSDLRTLMAFIPHWQPPSQRTPYAFQFGFDRNQMMLMPDEGDGQFMPQEPGCFPGATDEPFFLGWLDGIDCWAQNVPDAPAGWQPVPLRTAMMGLPQDIAAVAGRAAQVLEWDRSHRFCGACGTPTRHHESERSRVCPQCRHTCYPRLAPVAMALVWRPAELLLARSPHFARGMFSALAGFVEIGESIEECLKREVKEEVGVDVDELAYHSSQPWPFPHSLMIAFTARYTGGDIVLEEREIEAADWFSIDALPKIPPTFSIAGRLIRGAVQRMQENGGAP